MKAKKRLLLILAIFLLCYASGTAAQAVETIVYVGYDPYLAPFQFEQDGEAAGLHIDLMNEIAENYNFKITYIPFENKSDSVRALENGEIDLVLGIILDGNRTLKERYSAPISQSSIVMLAKKERAESIKAGMKDEYYTAAYELNTIGTYYQANVKNLRKVLAPNQFQAFDMLAADRVDVLICVRDSALYRLRQEGTEDEYTIINNLAAPVQYGVLAKSGEDWLMRAINSEINRMRFSGEYDQLYNKWCEQESHQLHAFVAKVFKIALVVGVIAFIIISGSLWINCMLRRQVEQKTLELQRANRQLEAQIIQTQNGNALRNKIVEGNATGIVVFTVDNEITLINPSALKLLGIEGDCTGLRIFEVTSLMNVLSQMPNPFETDEKIEREVEFNRDGQSCIYVYDIQLLYGVQEHLHGAMLSIEDVTDKVRAKNQMYEQEKNRSLNRILAGIAHEVRNPLTSIKTFVEMIPYSKGNPDFERDLVALVPKEIDRVSMLIKNLMDYAKPDDRNKSAVIVSEVVQSCTALLRHTTERANIKIETQVDPDVVIYADKNQLEQILINLVLNSVDACMAKGGTGAPIFIGVCQQGGAVRVTVRDEGVGMTAKQALQAVEPFFTTKPGGTGLGLYMVRQYTEENGGTFEIDSAEGEYTQVTLTFGGIE